MRADGDAAGGDEDVVLQALLDRRPVGGIVVLHRRQRHDLGADRASNAASIGPFDS